MALLQQVIHQAVVFQIFKNLLYKYNDNFVGTSGDPFPRAFILILEYF